MAGSLESSEYCLLAEFIQRCAAHVHEPLAKDDPRINPAGMKVDEICSSPHAHRTLEEAIDSATTTGDKADMSFASMTYQDDAELAGREAKLMISRYDF